MCILSVLFCILITKQKVVNIIKTRKTKPTNQKSSHLIHL